jgi:hypothetical protein
LHRARNFYAISQLLELLASRLAQVIDLARIGRDQLAQVIEFLGIAQIFRNHDLMDSLFNGSWFDFEFGPAGNSEPGESDSPELRASMSETCGKLRSSSIGQFLMWEHRRIIALLLDFLRGSSTADTED